MILPNLISNIKRLLGMLFVIMRGLLTEKSAKRNGPYRIYKWNSEKIEFKHRANREITGLSYITVLVIQALKTLGKTNWFHTENQMKFLDDWIQRFSV